MSARDNASFVLGPGRRGDVAVRVDLCKTHGFCAHQFRWLGPRYWESECTECRAVKREQERETEP